MSQSRPFVNSYVEQQYERHYQRAKKFNLTPLVEQLLKFGGEYVVLGAIETSTRRLSVARRVQGAMHPTIFTSSILPVLSVRFCPMVPKRCHWNVAALYLTGKIDKIATGFVLTQLETHTYWLAHSWGMQNGQVIETTDANKRAEAYYGIMLPDKEAKSTTANMAFRNPTILNESLYAALTTYPDGLKVTPIS